MDRDDIEIIMKKTLKMIEIFREEPTYENALYLDMNISIMRFIIGEQSFLPLHYFRTAHEEAIKVIDQHNAKTSKLKT